MVLVKPIFYIVIIKNKAMWMIFDKIFSANTIIFVSITKLVLKSSSWLSSNLYTGGVEETYIHILYIHIPFTLGIDM